MILQEPHLQDQTEDNDLKGVWLILPEPAIICDSSVSPSLWLSLLVGAGVLFAGHC